METDEGRLDIAGHTDSYYRVRNQQLPRLAKVREEKVDDDGCTDHVDTCPVTVNPALQFLDSCVYFLVHACKITFFSLNSKLFPEFLWRFGIFAELCRHVLINL